MDLSIIIPVYNEGNKITRDVDAALHFLVNHHIKGEIIIVDDGSKDDTFSTAIRFKQKSSTLNIIHYKCHQGKGYAVRTGILNSTGNYVMFADSGLCIPYNFTLNGLDILQKNMADMAHASRRLKESDIIKPQPLSRSFIAALMKRLFIITLKVPRDLSDTQCGFKVYKGEIARKLYAGSIINGFLFDIEIIIKAVQNGYRIKEFPVAWTSDPDSRLYPFKNFFSTMKELVILKRKLVG